MMKIRNTGSILRVLAWTIVALAGFGITSLAHATTIAVTTFDDVVSESDGVVSLREAIAKAESTAEPDEIQLRAGTYVLNQGAFEIKTSDLTITGLSEAKKTIIQFQNGQPGFGVWRVSFVLSHLTLDGGKRAGQGLLITWSDKDIVLQDVFLKNSGGVQVTGYSGDGNGRVMVSHCTFENLDVGIGGLSGGQYFPPITISQSTFVGNDIAIRVENGAPVTIRNSTFSDNNRAIKLSYHEIYDYKANISLESVTMYGNGAVLEAEDHTTGQVYLKNTLIVNNESNCDTNSGWVSYKSGGYNLTDDYCGTNLKTDQSRVVNAGDYISDLIDDERSPGYAHHNLLLGSTAINRASVDCILPDQLGNGEQDSYCDIGAVQAHPESDADGDGFEWCMNGDTGYGCDTNDDPYHNGNVVWGEQELHIDLKYAQVSGQQRQLFTWRVHNYATSDFTFVPTFYVDIPTYQHPVKLGTAIPLTIKAGEDGKGAGTWYIPNAALGTYYVWAEVEGMPVETSYDTNNGTLPIDTNNTMVTYEKTR